LTCATAGETIKSRISRYFDIVVAPEAYIAPIQPDCAGQVHPGWRGVTAEYLVGDVAWLDPARGAENAARPLSIAALGLAH
jgi:hypothetical protein